MPADLITLIALVAALLGGPAVILALPGRLPASGFHTAVGPFTPDEAHLVWQEHADCPMNACPALRTAYWTLVDAGKVTPDPQVTR